MRIFNPNQMAMALRQGAVGRAEVVFYALVQLVAMLAFFFEDPSDFATLPTYYTYLSLAAFATVLSIGVAYRANQSGDGKHFWYRYFSISFPLSVLVAVAALLTILAKDALLMFLAGSLTPPSLLISGVDVAIMSLFLFLSLYLIHTYMRKISRPQE